MKISEILVKELSYIYCHNCKFNDSTDDSDCDDCHRKNMSWELSEETAKSIEAKILEGEK